MKKFSLKTLFKLVLAASLVGSGLPVSATGIQQKRAPQSEQDINPLLESMLELKEKVASGEATSEEATQWEEETKRRRVHYRLSTGVLDIAFHPCAREPQSDECLLRSSEDRLEQLAHKGLSAEEVEMVLSFKSFVKSQIILQGLETRSRIACLEKASENEYSIPRTLEDPEVKAQCESFLTTGLDELVFSYREMKAYLALTQGKMRWDIRANDKVAKDQRDGTYCGKYKNPLTVAGTQLCTENLREILNVNPKHTAVKKQYRKANKVLEEMGLYKNLPEIPEIAPLTPQELILATKFYQEAYVAGPKEAGLFSEILEQELNLAKGNSVATELEQIRQQNKSDWASYFSALKYQGKLGWLSNLVLGKESAGYVEKSAKTAKVLYNELIQLNPPLVFFAPETKKTQVNCDVPMIFTSDYSVKMPEVCRAYLKQIKRKGLEVVAYHFVNRDEQGNIINKKPLIQAAKVAYEKSLLTNKIFVDRFDREFDSKRLLNELQFGATTKFNRVKPWLPLFGNEKSLSKFLEIHPEYKDLSERFVKAFRRSEIKKITLQIGGAIGLGIGCGLFLATIKYPVLCLLASGIGVNTYFYLDSYRDYQRRFMEFFSSPIGEMSLLELELVAEADQAMFLETLFLVVGINTRKIYNLSRPGIKKIKDYEKVLESIEGSKQ